MVHGAHAGSLPVGEAGGGFLRPRIWRWALGGGLASAWRSVSRGRPRSRRFRRAPRRNKSTSRKACRKHSRSWPRTTLPTTTPRPPPLPPRHGKTRPSKPSRVPRPRSLPLRLQALDFEHTAGSTSSAPNATNAAAGEAAPWRRCGHGQAARDECRCLASGHAEHAQPLR